MKRYALSLWYPKDSCEGYERLDLADSTVLPDIWVAMTNLLAVCT